MKIHRRKNTGQKAVKWLISCFVMLTLLVMQGEISGIGGGPTCPTCKKWDSYQGKCVNLCGCCYDCVDNNCIDKDLTEYIPNCKTCLGDDGEGGCEIWSWCDPAECQECVPGEFIGECVVCGGDPKKCCDNGQCKPKCNPDGPCLFEWPEVETPQEGCQNLDPTDKSCEQYIGGLICAWVAESYHTTSAECANCAPGCARNRTDPCVKLTPWKCNNDWIPFMGFFCVCNADDAGSPHDAGDYYECLE